MQKKVRRATVILLPVVMFCLLSSPARPDELTDLFEEVALTTLANVAKDQLLLHLQNRSTLAIQEVAYDRSCDLRRADFDRILDFAALAAKYAWSAYRHGGGCAVDASDFGESFSGPGGAFATVFQKTFAPGQAYPLPDGFPRPEGWGEDSAQGYKVVIVAFRGTDPLSPQDWLTNLQAGMGATPEQYRWALNMGVTVLSQFPDDYLVIFAGHSLGGALATYAALALKVGAITFNSMGLHPNNFSAALLYDPTQWHAANYTYDDDIPTSLDTVHTVDIENVYHFIAHSSDGITDIVSNLSFAGYSILPGGKYFVNIREFQFGTQPSLTQYVGLHNAEQLCTALDVLEHEAGTAGGAAMSCTELHGRAIYVHPQ